jgi:hypothetical protein
MGSEDKNLHLWESAQMLMICLKDTSSDTPGEKKNKIQPSASEWIRHRLKRSPGLRRGLVQ